MIDTLHHELYHQLKERLHDELPGLEAHYKMAPPQRLRDKKRYEPDEQTRIGGVLILIYPDEEGRLHFPMILRPEHTGVHSGQVALPGGKKDPEDEDVIDTALRETWEEIGVKVSRDQVIGQLSQLYIPPSNFLVYPTLAAISEKPQFNPSEYEVAELLTVDLMNFKEVNPRKEREITARYMKATVPYYDLLGQTVWGATAMILSEFLVLLNEIR